MRIPFYQTVWNGVNLIELAIEINQPLDELPTGAFYGAYYKKINSKTGIDQDWHSAKKDQSNWLKDVILGVGNEQSKILSIGAGTGIIEIPLIQSGFDIHLHDFQKESFQVYDALNLTTCYDSGLNTIRNVKYDLVVTIAMTYALDDSSLRELFRSVYSLLKPNGKFIILDCSLSWFEIYSYLRNRQFFKENCLLWGYKRDAKEYLKHADGFSMIQKLYYDSRMQEIYPFQVLGLPFSKTPTWQMMVFQKND